MSAKWIADQIPDQSGRTAVVTGANSGLGLVDATELARHGAAVIMAVRDTTKGQAAAREVAAAAGGPEPEVMQLDLSDLASVRAFADGIGDRTIDLLINNAGIMMTPERTTADGFELQFGTNHLGHFALTGLLLDRLQRAGAARVVTLSSIEHKRGHITFDDLHRREQYSPHGAYRQSKLANAVFAVELDRRLRAAGSKVISVFAHPGYSATKLQSTGPTGLLNLVLKPANLIFAQSAEQGALPTLYAATAAAVEGGSYYGPDGIAEVRGGPIEVRAIPEAYDAEVGRRLWEVSEELTGVDYGLPAATS